MTDAIPTHFGSPIRGRIFWLDSIMTTDNDPHDNVQHWVGRLPGVDNCQDCGCELKRHNPDKHDPSRCFYCAHKWRAEHDKSECCNADLFAQEVGFETEYGDYYVCQGCGDIQCED